ncbi:MAG: PhzF family phenazine biosynthesis protein [Xanthomonadaceae bacterium]|nr:PhzF family phenazine biosynthesis protein [Xanthomonadaceae bacterium]MDP2185267.1 PhzF family phenazine biosynthesis protein [Xanthomonadales bacterium]MDZ4115336.1 PhzF family phenazine biosynthesis protein [Xanthomonadaceae bacterium]MDZ4379678.1 PhzF family phenazine biosynthesis protein [Xanthomonadaceae bacterium]
MSDRNATLHHRERHNGALVNERSENMVAFKQVDVFTQRGFFGNPVAVILDAAGLGDADMQRIAHWTNLSETAFVLPAQHPDASYRVRIFTPRQELPFAGHPSVGSAHAVIEAGMVSVRDGRLIQECGAGLLPVRVEGSDREQRIFVRSPQARLEPVISKAAAQLATALGATPHTDHPPQVVNNGPRWWLVDLGTASTVRALQPDLADIAAFNRSDASVGVAVFGREPAGSTAALAVRCFCPADGIPEDPVTGSANACIAAWLAAHEQLPAHEYRASQGREIGRDGIVTLRVDGRDVWLGGHSRTIIDGQMLVYE